MGRTKPAKRRTPKRVKARTKQARPVARKRLTRMQLRRLMRDYSTQELARIVAEANRGAGGKFDSGSGRLRARYEASLTNDENSRHWKYADGLSGNAAASPSVRAILRNRSRHEVANNSYAKGLLLSLANDTIGRGPRLQLISAESGEEGGLSREDCRRIERSFRRWAKEVGLAKKLRLAKMSKAESGEVFIQKTTNPGLSHPVKLDFRLIEADQVTTPDEWMSKSEDQAVDGIVFDSAGNPAEYHILKEHPGSTAITAGQLEYRRVSAKHILHWFRQDRVNAARGIPEILPALPLFACLRRFTLAVLGSAETAAEIAGVVYTDSPAADVDKIGAFETMDMNPREWLTMPEGWKVSQVKGEQPTTTYGMFKSELLAEIGRCVLAPYNVMSGNSASYNYASGRLDHQSYDLSIGVEREDCEAVIIDKLLQAWFEEAVLIEGLLPQSLRTVEGLLELPEHRWFWPGRPHVDPEKEARADATKLQNNTTTLADIYAAQGEDWEEKLEQRGREIKRMQELGIPIAAAHDNTGRPADAAPPPDPEEEPSVNPDGSPRTAKAAARLSAAAPADESAMELRAAIEFTSDGKLRIPRFTISAYTGVPLTGVMRQQRLPIVVDLQGLQASRAAVPVLKDHNPSLIVGHTDRIINDGRTLSVTGVASGAGQVSQEVVQSAKDGFPWQASITASVLEVEEIPRGKRVNVNGRDFAGPIAIARKSKLKEVSFVALGADDNTSAAIAAKESIMTFEQWLKAKGWKSVSDLTHEQEATLRAAYSSEVQAGGSGGGEGDGGSTGDGAAEAAQEPASAGTATATAAAAGKARGKGKGAASGQRRQTITASANGNGANGAGTGTGGEGDGGADAALDRDLNAAGAATGAAGQDQPITLADMQAAMRQERERVAAINRRCTNNEIIAQAVSQGWDPVRAELEDLRAGRPGAPAAHSRDSESRRTSDVLSAALCRTAGMDGEFLEAQFNERTLEAAEHRDYRGIGIQGVLHEVIRAAGGYAPRGNFSDDTIRAAFQAHQTLMASAGQGFSTVSLTSILGDSANKAMLRSFLAVEAVLPQICRVRSVKDFKSFTSLRMTAKGEFTKVGPTGELKTIGLQESSYANRLDTYGAIVALSRQMMYNDDLGAFLELPQHLGRLSATCREETGFAQLLSNPGNFFSAGNKNYQSGAATVLSISSLSTAKKKFRQMKDPNGKLAMIVPGFLLVPSALEPTAEAIYESEFVNETTTADNKGSPSRNPHKGKFKPIVAAHLDNDAMSGYSALAWYLLANPADRAIMELAYLNGQQNPTIESGETSFETLGMQWRGFFDFGVAMAEEQAGVMSKGEA